MRHLFVYTLLSTGLVFSSLGQSSTSIPVDINLDIKHSVGDFSTFDRAKWINLHADLTDSEWDSDALRDQFLEEYDVYLGRNNGLLPWHVTQITEDPNKPGWPNVNDIATRATTAKKDYASSASAHKHESRLTGMMIGGQWANYPKEKELGPTSAKWQLVNNEAAAEYYAHAIKHFFGEGGSSGQPAPTYVEVINEPMWNAVSGHNTTREAVADFHNAVAEGVRALNPDVKVGGFTAAATSHQDNDFLHWEQFWKMFIDRSGESMDFFSLHLYDTSDGLPDGPEDVQYVSGSRTEAKLEMVEHYSKITLGEVKPWVISEYGYWGRAGLDGTPYTKERDWGNIRSFSSIMMQLMERPHTIEKSMPFIILKANWWGEKNGNKYPYRLLRQKSELDGETGNEWVYTEIVKFYQLWSDVKGTRIDTHPGNLDIQVDAYVDGNKMYLILNNLLFEDQTIDLNMAGVNGNTITNVTSKQTLLVNNEPVLEEKTLTLPVAQVELAAEGTMILEYAFENDVLIDETSDESRYYADDYLKPIASGKTLSYNIDGVGLADQGEAVLRLGIGRDHSMSKKPTITVNGSAISVPTNYRGYDQNNFDTFFGVLEIPVPYHVIKANNEVKITFPDTGGHISSLALQVSNFSREVKRSTPEVEVKVLSNEVRLTNNLTIFPNPAKGMLNISGELVQNEYRILNLSGIPIKQGIVQGGTISLNGLPTGLYVLILADRSFPFIKK